MQKQRKTSSSSFPSSATDIKQFLDRGFRAGAVLRVSMLNFLTYDKCEVFPGPHLNVILGPNGVGKSTITHAICLACCGKPENVGRSSSLRQFVKRDKADGDVQCFVEIDLLDVKSSRIQTVRRQLKALSDASVWYLNGVTCTETKVRELMNLLHIDVSNLCSFMPQDKVGKFSTYTPEQILQETLKCVRASEGEKSLYDEQVELSNIDDVKVKTARDLQAKRDVIEILRTQLRDLKVGVERMEERGRAEKMLKFYQIKEIVVLADAQEARIKTIKEGLELLEAAKAAVDAKIAPLEAAEREQRKHEQVYERSLDTKREKKRTLEDQIAQSGPNIEAKSQDMDDKLAQLQGVEKSRKKFENMLMKEQENLKQLQEELRNALASDVDNQSKLKEVIRKFKALQEEETNIDDDLRMLDNNINQCKRKLDGINREASNLQDSREKFKEKLRRYDNNTLRDAARNSVSLMEFIERNEKLFHAPVYGPIGLYVNSRDPAILAIAEKSIRAAQLVNGFCAQNEHDAGILNSEMAKQGWKISVHTMTGGTSDMAYKPQQLAAFSRNHNVLGYLVDQLENLPAPVRSYLIGGEGYFGSLVARLPPNQLFDADTFSRDVGDASSFKIYTYDASNISEIFAKKSRFSGKFIPSSNIVHPAKLLSAGGGADEEEQRKNIEDRKSVELKALEQLQRQKQQVDQRKRAIDGQINELQRERSMYQKYINLPKDLENRVQSSIRKIAELEKSLSADMDRDKAVILKKYVKDAEELQNIMAASLKLSKELLQCEISINVLQAKKKAWSKQSNSNSRELHDLKLELRNKSEDLTEQKRLFANACSDLKRLEEKLSAKEAENGGSASFDKLYQEVTIACPEHDIEKIKDKIEYYHEIIRSSVGDNRIEDNFKRVSKELKIAEEELVALNAEVDRMDRTLEDRSLLWKVKVGQCCERINKLFEAFMGRIGYSGETVLVKADRFIEYSINLKVTFREDSLLANLSGARHSGGERAVSTITYLMAMQGLTASPWRIVDEINQGMDNSNERNVLGVISDCCSSTSIVDLHLDMTRPYEPESNSNYNPKTNPIAVKADMTKQEVPQYFLVSPKLLQGLRCLDRDDVTILIVCNGPGVDESMSWDMDAMILELERKTNSAHVDL